MTQRLLGALLIVLGGSLYGVAMARHLHARVRQVGELVSALHLLEGEIAFARSPLPEALAQVSRASHGQVRELFAALAAELGAAHMRPVSQVWSSLIVTWAGRTALGAEEISALESLGAILGRTGADDQVRALRHTSERLRGIVGRLENSVERDARLRLYLGVAGGVTLAILLV